MIKHSEKEKEIDNSQSGNNFLKEEIGRRMENEEVIYFV